MTPLPLADPLARVLLRSQSDERLARLAQEGHKGAFDEIVRRYRTPLVAFAAAYAPERAEDVVQEGFANAWISLEGSNREFALKPWLYTIIRNRALNARRDTRYHSELDETIDGVPRPDQIVLERDELRRAVAAIAVLPEAQRKALVQSAIEGRTHDQIAAELNTSAGSVRGLIHRGRVAVRGAMGALIPIPVVAWAAGSGGAAAGGVAAGSAVGGSLASTGAAVATIAVLATGSGIVVERSLNDAGPDRQAKAAEVGKGKEDSGQARPGDRDEGAGQPQDPGGSAGPGPQGEEDDRGPGGGEKDSSGPGGGDDEGPEREDDDSSGPGSGDDSDDDSSGHGSGGGDDDDSSGHDPDDDDSSGPGSGEDDEDDSSGSGSGSGSDDSGSDDEAEPEDDEDEPEDD
jgi:RNA polymerase sigma factor (sigma-70 family)